MDVSDCVGITDNTLQAIGERCGVLESLGLGMCPLLSTRAVQEVGGSVVLGVEGWGEGGREDEGHKMIILSAFDSFIISESGWFLGEREGVEGRVGYNKKSIVSWQYYINSTTSVCEWFLGRKEGRHGMIIPSAIGSTGPSVGELSFGGGGGGVGVPGV